MKKNSLFIILLILIFSFSSLYAVEIKFKGLVQNWFSYAQDNSSDYSFGFTARRVRLKVVTKFSKKVVGVIQGSWDKQTTGLIDAYLDLKFKPELNLRFGKFTVPASVSTSLTSSGKLDFVERSMFVLQWAKLNGLAGFRTFGAQLSGKLYNKKIYYAFMVGNPETALIFTPSVKSSTYSGQKDLFVGGRIEIFPMDGFRIGSYATQSKITTTDIKNTTYGAHLFYVKNGINFKIEFMKGEKNFLNLEETQNYNGFFLKLGYKLSKRVESLIRYDAFTPNDGGFDKFGVKKYNNYTAGINYFFCKHVKFQVNYVIRDENMEAGFTKLNNNIFYVNVQYSF